jgi:hypothetical protein
MSTIVERTKQNPLLVDSGVAHEALTGYENRFITVTGDATGSAEVAKNTTAGGVCHGVLMPMNDGSTTIAAATNVSFAVLGVMEVEAGEAFNAGVELMSNATGQAVAQTGTGQVLGWAREASSASAHLISMMWAPRYEAS